MIGGGFRKDIEGLRALAVLPILLFHLDPRLCPGGFAGVDVFFVISGYLITRMILAEGALFSLKAFYLRRFFRLFPALLTTLLLSLAAGWWILAPQDYAALARSALAAGLGMSNLYFLAAVDYFNASSLLHPLLHTWSLGAEEQFYLVWPAVILLALRWAQPWWVFAVVMTVVSLAAIPLVQPSHPQLVFYMMPFRVFEFGIGAGVLALERPLSRAPPGALAAAGTAGAGLLVASLAVFDAQTPWPGLWALTPVIGTALLIVAGRAGMWRSVLALGVLRVLGRSSYSIYLVHWPLITLYRYHVVVEPDVWQLALLGIASVVLGIVLYAAVERRFRIRGSMHEASTGVAHRTWASLGPQPNVAGTAVLATSIVLLAGSALAVLHTGGFPSRLDRERIQILDKGLTFAGDLCSYKRSTCVFGDREATRTVYVMGDSHALNLVYGLDRLFSAAGIRGIAFYDHGCLFIDDTTRFSGGVLDERCQRNVAEAYAQLARTQEPVILAADYASYWNAVGPGGASTPLRLSESDFYAWLRPHVRRSLERLGAGRRIVLMKQAYTTGIDLPQCLGQPGASAAQCAPLTLAEVQQRYAQADRMIELVAKDLPAVTTLDPKTIFCASGPCITQGDAGLFFRDKSHLTNAGSEYLVEHARQVLLDALVGPR